MVVVQVYASHRKKAPGTILHITNMLHRMASELAGVMTLRQCHVMRDRRRDPVA